MQHHTVKAVSTAAAVALLGLSVGLSVQAQIPAGNPPEASAHDPANQKIDLDLESTNLYYGLKLLFSQIKANFTIDESLKSLTVTAHLTQVPFRAALETLLKSTSIPLTYKVENGIYSVVPKVEAAAPEQINEAPAAEVRAGGYKYGVIHPSNLSSADIVGALGGNIVSIGYNKSTYGSGGLSGGSGGGSGGIGGGFGGGGLGSGNGGGLGGSGGMGSSFGSSSGRSGGGGF